jgi:hypothetical protein
MRVAVVVSVVCICVNADGAELTAATAPSGDGIARGLVHVQCKAADQVFWLSRGAILEIDARRPRGEVIVTTAHGLPRAVDAILRDCVVLGRESERHKVAAVWNAGRFEEHVSHDWVVLLTKGRLDGRVGRLRVGLLPPAELPDLIADGMSVWLLWPVGDSSRSQCQMLGGAEHVAEDFPLGLLTYSCRARPGLSGAPLLVGVDQQPVMIGIHVGWRTLLGESGGWSVGRLLDSEIYEAIDAAVRQARR